MYLTINLPEIFFSLLLLTECTRKQVLFACKIDQSCPLLGLCQLYLFSKELLNCFRVSTSWSATNYSAISCNTTLATSVCIHDGTLESNTASKAKRSELLLAPTMHLYVLSTYIYKTPTHTLHLHILYTNMHYIPTYTITLFV